MPETYRLTWEHGGEFVLPEAQASKVVASWRRHGVVTGDLADGRVSFWSDFGQRALLNREPTAREDIPHAPSIAAPVDDEDRPAPKGDTP